VPSVPVAPSAPSAPSGASPGAPAIPGYAPGEGLPAEPGNGTMPEIELMPPGMVPLLPEAPNQSLGSAIPLAPQAPQAVDLKSLKYKVSKFTIKYGPPAKPPHAGLPPVKELSDAPVMLGQAKEKDGGLVGPGAGARDFPVTLSRVTTPETFSGDALQAIYEAVVKVINKRGIYGVFVIVDPTQVNPTTGEDLRKGATDLTLLVYASQVRQVRTIVKPVPKAPFKAASTSINDPKYARITADSPLQPGTKDQPGSLLYRDSLQDYLDRINRFPGRRVDVAVTASGEEAGVVLDYIVRVERPPVFLFDQTSNTGTKASGSWRTRAGFELRQLAGLDDTLDASFESSLSTETYSAFGSYEITPVFPDIFKLKVYGGYGRFLAEDVGFDESRFTGRSATAGLLAIYTPVHFHGFPIDLIGGAEYKNVQIVNAGANAQEGQTNFLLPIAGIATDKTTDQNSFFASLQLEPNLPGLAGTSNAAIQNMGRFDVNKSFFIGKYSFGASQFLEPLIFRKEWDAYADETDPAKRKAYWPKVTLAQEVAFLLHGQYTFDDKRLIPQFEDVVGGFASVRGYPEAFAAGDDTVVFNAEYRVHLPRLFKPLDTDASNDPAKPPPPAPWFALRPPTILGRPDLDVILRAFYDVGYVENNNLQPSTEVNRTLMSVGFGGEVQVLRYLNLRLDCGFPLISEIDETSRPVHAGSPRVSFVGVLSY
jgi:hemolysin activation/secretion protein